MRLLSAPLPLPTGAAPVAVTVTLSERATQTRIRINQLLRHSAPYQRGSTKPPREHCARAASLRAAPRRRAPHSAHLDCSALVLCPLVSSRLALAHLRHSRAALTLSPAHTDLAVDEKRLALDAGPPDDDEVL